MPFCSNDDVAVHARAGNAARWLCCRTTSVGVVGPLSNAPGWTNTRQNIWDHVPDYEVSDAPEQLATVAGQLRRAAVEPPTALAVEAVNGFFMIARTARWWEGRLRSEACVRSRAAFCPDAKRR